MTSRRLFATELGLPKLGKRRAGIIVLVLLLFILMGVSLFTGAAQTDSTIILESRIPRLLAVVFCGAGLVTAGIIMQRISRNRFVSPEIAGTTDSAALGFLIGIILFPEAQTWIRTLFAAVVAGLGSLLFLGLVARAGKQNEAAIPLIGLVLAGILGSAAELLAYKFDLLQTLSGWLSADFSLTIVGRYEAVLLIVPAFIVAYMYAHRLTIVGMGRDFAEGVGMNYTLIRFIGILIVAAISAITVLVAGRVPFLGLIIPNLVAFWFGENVHKILPLAAVGGAVVLLAADIAGRLLIMPAEMPVGLTMGLVGAGVFLWIISSRRTSID